MIYIVKEMYLISKKDLDVLNNKIASIQNIIKNYGYKNLENPDKIYTVFNEIENYCRNIDYILYSNKDSI